MLFSYIIYLANVRELKKRKKSTGTLYFRRNLCADIWTLDAMPLRHYNINVPDISRQRCATILCTYISL